MPADITKTFTINSSGNFNCSSKGNAASDLLKAQRAASRRTVSRAFSTTSTRHAEVPGPNANPSSPIPPVTPARAEGRAKLTTPAPASLKAAAELKKVIGRATETYTAYGSTEVLYKECARQADYAIPQAGKDDEELPKTKNGEDLGIGEGWWHTGMFPWAIVWACWAWLTAQQN